jgi:hypothetical protein
LHPSLFSFAKGVCAMSLSAFQRRRRELAKLQEQQEGKEPAGGDNQQLDQLTHEQVESMTKNEIMAELKKRGIEFDQRDNKETLKGVLLDAIK